MGANQPLSIRETANSSRQAETEALGSAELNGLGGVLAIVRVDAEARSSKCNSLAAWRDFLAHLRTDSARHIHYLAADGETLVSTTDLRSIITNCNPAFFRISGVTKEERIGHAHHLARHPDITMRAEEQAGRRHTVLDAAEVTTMGA